MIQREVEPEIMSNVLNCTNYNIEIPQVVASDGIYLFDHKGKRYMDLESGVWCTSLLAYPDPNTTAILTSHLLYSFGINHSDSVARQKWPILS